MTPPGLFTWEFSLRWEFNVAWDGGTFSCPIRQWGQDIAPSACRKLLASGVGGVTLNPADARIYIGIAPATPVDFAYPAEGAVIRDYVYTADFSPAPDYVQVAYASLIINGPRGFHTFCETTNPGGPRSGGCAGFVAPDIVEHATTGSGAIVDDPENANVLVVPPSDIAYDDSEEGSTLWPYGSIGDAFVALDYGAAEGGIALTSYVEISYWIFVRPYWIVGEQPTPPGNSTITAGTLARGVRRRVATPTF